MRKTLKPIAAIAACLLAGCATQKFNSGLKSLVGQDIHAAIDRLGYPDAQREVLGDTVYIWTTDHTDVLPIYGGLVPLQARCTLQIGTTPEGAIRRYQWSGNEAGCSGYSRALTRH